MAEKKMLSDLEDIYQGAKHLVRLIEQGNKQDYIITEIKYLKHRLNVDF